ncbi:FAD:protein FMN transferase [Ponticoccus sp. SC2-23]|uniref:FAD:protein FMN transferase n=1 Tax=Alexandriicola marinus TaxID=2081710 RepID=UPI000FDC2B77|nr:FAD:protein FMN transferase [Alexandriicola marinus]MBM1218981.1 FAD:protein FMN transferase [Ponticoccus sp. SC6-9]MBM1223947.1 FAD:protein FMN transferase [Ponticoccus sp. SC6-15]MBM1230274.1 FAD:protein FMN transferase [Ponticoccus sp. SC6-38]MBM1232913.1 FAD:protein FMN transferase [Ponticoccus sp. SC6-45]MBM1237137.1 FAD:protein FMN transferase [Ponticoccus sp. SC6-49]MBM1241924.1 FAD:protein FMN transferase [Ponticoccus sp. SC2-64]MBM1246437.1 FAD:protein FMN transferase [Ponticoccu
MSTLPFHPSRRAALGLLGAAFVAPGTAMAGQMDVLEGAAFATRWRVLAPRGAGLAQLRPEIEALFAQIDRQFSPWRSDSEISRFNAEAEGIHTAGTDLARVAEAALDLARRSEGAFDPTVGPLVAQRGFGPISHGAAPDWRGLGAGQGTLTKARADLTLDLCGIAKGWALDRAAEIVRGAGARDFLFEIGGEFVTAGHHPDGRDWRVAVEAPVPFDPGTTALRLPPGAAVATSGTRAQSYDLNGRLYSHIIAPPEGRATFVGHRSVTVIAADAMTADGWATALCAAGEEAGPDLAAGQDITALFQFDTGGTRRIIRSGGMSDLIV